MRNRIMAKFAVEAAMERRLAAQRKLAVMPKRPGWKSEEEYMRGERLALRFRHSYNPFAGR